MIGTDSPGRRGRRRPGTHWRGHAFLFEKRGEPTFAASAGIRLLLIFGALEGVLGPRLWLFDWLRLSVPPPWLRYPILLGVALLLVRSVAGLPLSQIGFHPWRAWSAIEKSYFLQVLPLATAVFSVLFAHRLRLILAEPSLWGRAGIVLLTYFVWGIYQEVMYRGILQTELVRRWGALPGILVSNTLYTFGPLHYYHFSGAHPLAMFVSIFAIGLFLALLLRRSGNLWMVAIFHGLGDCYFTGLGTLGP